MPADPSSFEASQPTCQERRTGLAEDRTLLANERTFASWTRTVFALIALAPGFQVISENRAMIFANVASSSTGQAFSSTFSGGSGRVSQLRQPPNFGS